MNFLNQFQNSTTAYHVLRISLAVLMLLHGVSKLLNGIGGIEGMLVSHGLPAALAYGVYVGEVAMPLLMLAGIAVVPSALVMAVNMVVAILLAHTGQFFTLANSGGWALELQAFFLISAIAVALMAPPCKVLNRLCGKSKA